MKICIGTSGWSYKNWKDIFYPKELKSSEWLSYYSEHFHSIEINSSFYRLPTHHMMQHWYDATSTDFLFSIKAWRAITHYEKLINCRDSVMAFMDRVQLLKHKCVVILFQLPYSFTKNLEIMENFIAILPKSYKYVFEFRHPSWWNEEIYTLLSKHNSAFCIFELGRLKSPHITTADFNYIRLHGDKEAYRGKYTSTTLKEWQTWLHDQNKDTYLYFDNTMDKDDAIQNAKDLQKLLTV